MTEMHDRLETAREAAGYDTAAAACEAFGWKYPTYVGHENGSRGFKGKAEVYARRYGVSLEWLLTGKGDMKAGPESGTVIQIWSRIPREDRPTAIKMLQGLAKDKKEGA